MNVNIIKFINDFDPPRFNHDYGCDYGCDYDYGCDLCFYFGLEILLVNRYCLSR